MKKQNPGLPGRGGLKKYLQLKKHIFKAQH